MREKNKTPPIKSIFEFTNVSSDNLSVSRRKNIIRLPNFSALNDIPSDEFKIYSEFSNLVNKDEISHLIKSFPGRRIKYTFKNALEITFTQRFLGEGLPEKAIGLAQKINETNEMGKLFMWAAKSPDILKKDITGMFLLSHKLCTKMLKLYLGEEIYAKKITPTRYKGKLIDYFSEKTCYSCHETKNITEFSKYGGKRGKLNTKGSYRSNCIDCRNKERREKIIQRSVSELPSSKEGGFSVYV